MREQLNKGIVPPDIDIHALAGLIKVSDPEKYCTPFIFMFFLGTILILEYLFFDSSVFLCIHPVCGYVQYDL